MSKKYIGIPKEFPVLGETTVTTDITSNNISNYFTVSNGTYYFEGVGSVFTSNNKGINSAVAETILTAKCYIASISFDYSWSSEKVYDKFTLKVGDTVVEKAVSGTTTNKSYSGGPLNVGDKIIFTYSKDKSANGNDDVCTFSNMSIVSKEIIGTEIVGIARKVKKSYIGINNIARSIQKIYVGVNGVAKLLYEGLVLYKDGLTFYSPNSFTLAVNDATKHWDGILEYSTNRSTWSTWNGTTTLSSKTGDNGDVLYLRGTGNTVITGNGDTYKWVLKGTSISCVGNIETLLDYATVASGGHPDMADYCYAYLFQDCKSLTTAPALPATTLVPYCYCSMFFSCSGLTQAPALPATTLAEHCYDAMFRGGLFTEAPELPATTLADFCYFGMFQLCKNLTTAPALPATTLAKGCYRYMFSSCSSLTTAPALPATTLAQWCYADMFFRCNNLVQIPALPATTLETGCYYDMFMNCGNVQVSSTNTEEYTVPYRIPISGTGTSANSDCMHMFATTGGTFTGNPSINTTYYLRNTNTVIYP